MAKAKILAMAKETREYTDKGGKLHKMRHFVIGNENEKYDGFYPSAHMVKLPSGREFPSATTELDLSVFGGYDPKIGDIINIEYGPHDRIVSITKAAN